MGKRKGRKRGNMRSSRKPSSNVNSLTYTGRVGLTTTSSASNTYWMTPNSAFTSSWTGFAPVIGGVFGPNANNLAHTFKQFRIKALRVEVPPMTGSNQIVAYTQQVGYLTTTLSFPGIMDYPCAVYSGLGETHRLFMTVPKQVLRSTTNPWFSTEDNPGTSSTDPQSDPNLSSHGLLIITDGGGNTLPYILYFTIEFRNPENSAQIGPAPSVKWSHEDLLYIRKLRGLSIADADRPNQTDAPGVRKGDG